MSILMRPGMPVRLTVCPLAENAAEDNGLSSGITGSFRNASYHPLVRHVYKAGISRFVIDMVFRFFRVIIQL